MPLTGESRRDYDVKRARAASARMREIEIPAIVNKRRRRRLEKKPESWLAHYMPSKFSRKFTDVQREMLHEVVYIATHGGYQSIADRRGGGKTSIVEGAIVYAICCGLRRFHLITAATGDDAARILANVKYEFEANQALLDDYPEICAPIWALEGAPQRAAMQTVNGKRTRLKWGTDHVRFPRVDGSPASGSIVAARGLDGAIRGLKFGDMRPDLVLIDDADTRESANSETQTRSREEIIERDIGGLGGPGVRVATIMLCTILNRTCIAFTYTDRQQKPAWRGRRRCLLTKKPQREDLWDDYIAMRQNGMRRDDNPDSEGREAMAFYLKNRAAMDEGGETADPTCYIDDLLEDGSPVEVSSLQYCYNIIADRGLDAFQTEYQNEPPEDAKPEESGISANLVRSRLNNLPRHTVTDDVTRLVCALDLRKRYIHWTAIGWIPGATGLICNYGVQDVYNAEKIGIEKALIQALHEWRENMLAGPVMSLGEKPVPIDLALIDSGSGLHEPAVMQFCREVGGKPFVPSKGFGGGGFRGRPYRAPSKAAPRFIGDHWYISRQAGRPDLYCLDTDYWKRFVHERFLTPADRPGSLSLFGTKSIDHLSFSKHIVAEVWRERNIPGKGMKAFWDVVNPNNHWLDCTYMCCAAASMMGISLLPAAKQPEPQTQWFARRLQRA